MAAIENLITENMDVWTSAIKQRARQGRGSSKKQELYGIQKLRELILELAVRGLLVPQDPNDEPVCLLLDKITIKKEAFIKERKIRKTKPMPKISNKDIPFQAPHGWVWARLGDLGIGATGKTPSTKTAEYFDGEIPFIGPGQITPSGKLLESDKTLTKEGLKHSSEAVYGDILMVCIGGSVGKSVIADRRVAFNQQINSIHPFEVMSEFLFLTVNTKTFYQLVVEKSSGSATPIINRSKWEELPVPIAPLNEQKRIVAKVDELMALCDQLEERQENNIAAHQQLVEVLLAALTQATDAETFEQAWAHLAANFETLFTTENSIDQLKQTLLQLAVMGKLVPQDPNDEPASVLLEKIAAEKEKLIKEGKIKRLKKIPELKADKVEFNLPSGWSYCTLSHIGFFSGGKTPSKSKHIYWGGAIPWVTPKDMKSNEIFDSEEHVTKKAVEDGLALYDKESILMVARSGILRRKFPIAITKNKVSINQDLKVLSLFDKTLSSYIKVMLNGFESYILKNLTKTGMTVESLMFDEFSMHYFLLPPKNEQKRIVAKVDQLFAICDQLKDKIRTAEETQLQLADALTSQAVQ